MNEYFRCDATSPILKLYKDIVNSHEIMKESELMSINFDTQFKYSEANNLNFDIHKSFIKENTGALIDIQEDEEEIKRANS